MILIAAKKRRLLAEVEKLEHELAAARRIQSAVVDHAEALQDRLTQAVARIGVADSAARELADKVNAIEAQAGHWSASSSTVYRKAAKELTAILEAEPLAEWERELLVAGNCCEDGVSDCACGKAAS